MGRRKYYSRKNLGKEMYAGLVICILLVIGEILTFIQENPSIIFTVVVLISVVIMTKLYFDYKNKLKEEQRRQEHLRSCKSINHLLNKFKSNPIAFESYVADVFASLGYKTEVTKATNDGGKDIIMYKEGVKYVVEVKLYSENNKVGREKIQKLQGAMIDSNADKSIFVTTSKFTKESINYGQKHGIILIDGKALVKLIDKALGEDEFSHANNETNPIVMIENLFE